MHLVPDADDLNAIRDAVLALVDRIAAESGRLSKLAYREREAAELLSLNEHQLRDERRRGRITASMGPGGIILYTRDDLLAYLTSRRWTEETRRRRETAK